MKGLPHWARVAFAARCARRLHNLVSGRWPEEAEACSSGAMQAIELIEESAAEGQAVDGLQEAAKRAALAAQQVVAASMQNTGGDAEAVQIRSAALVLALKVAEKAAECALAAPVDSSMAGAEAWLGARSVAGLCEESDIMAALKSDFNGLYQAAQRSKWTDGTRIPIEIWNMI